MANLLRIKLNAIYHYLSKSIVNNRILFTSKCMKMYARFLRLI